MKKMFGQVVKFVYFFSCFFTLFTNYAHAYIDPAAFTIFRHKIFAFFKKNKKSGETEEDTIEFKDVDE